LGEKGGEKRRKIKGEEAEIYINHFPWIEMALAKMDFKEEKQVDT